MPTISISNFDCLHVVLGFRIESGYLHQTTNIHRAYRLSFLIKPLDKMSVRSEILSFKTVEGVVTTHIKFKKDTTMLTIRTMLIGSFLTDVIRDMPLPLMVYSSITVTQQLNPRGFYDYQVFINDSLVYRAENRLAESHSDVSVYASSEGSTPADAVIKDLNIEQLNDPG